LKNAIVVTNGCPENRIDCAEIEQLLAQNSLKITTAVDEADLIILNLCGLLDSTEKDSLDMIKSAINKKKVNARLLVTGCLPKINNNSIKHIFKGDIIKGHNIKELSQQLDIEIKPNRTSTNYLIPGNLLPKSIIRKIVRRIQNIFDIYFILYLFKFSQYWKYWKQNDIVQSNTFYIKVSSGCTHACSYCVVKKSRGSVQSKPVGAIKSEFLKGLKAGYTKFALMGTDIGSYGMDVQTDLTALISELVSIDGKFEIKLRNVHPQFLINHLPELLSLVKTNKITHITTAIQSGNDRILGLMKRAYSIKDCKFAINALKNICPNLKIRIQLIVGFPGETNFEFNDTLRLIDGIKTDFVEVYPFSKRNGTLAAKMPNQVPEKIINKRRYITIKKTLIYLKGNNIAFNKNELFCHGAIALE